MSKILPIGSIKFFVNFRASVENMNHEEYVQMQSCFFIACFS